MLQLVAPQEPDLGFAQPSGVPLDRVVEAAVGLSHPSSSLGPPDIDESSLVAVAESLYRRARNEKRWRRVEGWEYNRAFREDHAWAIWDSDTNQIVLDPPRSDSSSKRVQINLFKRFVQTAAARITATHPVILVHSTSQDQEDQDNAMVSQVWLDFEWNRQEMPRLMARASEPFMLDGTMIAAVEYDKTAGRIIGEIDEPVLDEMGYPVLDETTGEPLVQTIAIREGEIVTRRVDCRNFFVEPHVEDLKDMQYVLEVTPRSPAWIYRNYRVAVQPDGNDHLHQASIDSHYTGDLYDSSTVLEYRVWIAPGPLKWGPNPQDVVDLPKGMYFCVAGGRVLEGPWENPYDDLEFPYIDAKAMPVDGEYFGETIFNSLRSPQVTLNKIASLVLESCGYMGMPVWLEPQSAGISDADRTNMPGAWIQWDDTQGQQPPVRIDGKGPASSVLAVMNWLIEMFHSITGLHEGALGGGAPKNIESAVGLEVLTERDATQMSITAMEVGRFIKQWGDKTLSRGHQFQPNPKTIRRLGRQMEYEVIEWSGSMVNEGHEVRVVAESIQPMTKQQRIQEAMIMLQMGVWTVEDARRHIGTDMLMSGELTTDQMQRNLARNENKQARSLGRVLTPVEQMSIEDHLLHIEEHERELFHPANQDWSQGVPPSWMATMAHLQMHYKLLGDEMARQQGAAPGAAAPQESAPPTEQRAMETA